MNIIKQQSTMYDIFGYYEPKIDEYDPMLVWHREGGLPSFTGQYEYSFYVQNMGHRTNGPYEIIYDGPSTSWSLYDYKIDPVEYFAWLEETGIDINNITESDKLLIHLHWRR